MYFVTNRCNENSDQSVIIVQFTDMIELECIMKYFDLSFTIGKAAGRFSVPTSVCDEKILTVAKKCTNLFRMGGMIPDVIRGCLTIDNKVSYAYNAKTMSDSEYYFDKFLGFTEGDKKR